MKEKQTDQHTYLFVIHVFVFFRDLSARNKTKKNNKKNLKVDKMFFSLYITIEMECPSQRTGAVIVAHHGLLKTSAVPIIKKETK